jgi:predicted alpha/beta superfamily hydrolase
MLGLALSAVAARAQTSGIAPVPAADAIPRHEEFPLDSRALAERRTINVYTPPAYAAAGGTSFPVLYMPDGGLAEDFPHVANTIDSLIGLGLIRPVIVVGIENTQRRRDLTGPTSVASDSTIAPKVGGSAAFRRFVREELMPEIRRRYRCNGETTIVGESLAGLFVVETFLLEPTLFDRYIAFSPSVWWNRGALLRAPAAGVSYKRLARRTIFLSAANEQQISDGTALLVVQLRTRSPASLELVYEPRPDLEHSTIFRAVAPRAFARVLR